MKRRTRLRRTGILCLHALRNAAYYRAWTAASNARRNEQFWRTLNGNFIDTCLLEWCKLFGDLRAVHHWSKVVTDAAKFTDGLHAACGVSADEFEAYRLEVRTYRDKFVAHLDELNEMKIPNIQCAIDSVRFLYNYLLDNEDDCDAFADGPGRAHAYYQRELKHGRESHQDGAA